MFREGGRREKMSKDTSDWIEKEFESADLGDVRLNNRLQMIVGDFYERPNASIPQAVGDFHQVKATYRFFDNHYIDPEQILTPHFQKTNERCADHEIVLAVNDTSYLEFTSHAETNGLGTLSEEHTKGMLLHPTFCITPDGIPLGLVDVQSWIREPEEYGKSNNRIHLPIEEKESNKWLKSYIATAKMQQENPHVNYVYVGDRESDIYELFELSRSEDVPKTDDGKRPEILIRAVQNRCIDILDEETHIWDAVIKQEKAGVRTFKIPRRKNQPMREATVDIHFTQVTIQAPKNKKNKIGSIKVNAIWAYEKHPPKGVERISWKLLTTMEINNLEDAIEKIEWYIKRWMIELLFRVLKSGCRFEERQLGTAERLKRCLAVDLIVAWRILYITMYGREHPTLPCTALFEEDEWKALYFFVNKTTTPPEEIPKLQTMVRMLAKLGGFLGRKNDREPGMKTIWLGLHRLNDITESYLLFNTKT
jgi:hypothetical protein